MRPPPEDAVAVVVVGRSHHSASRTRVNALLDRGSRRFSAFPERPVAPVAPREMLSAYSCGGSRGFGQGPHRVPFYVPSEGRSPPSLRAMEREPTAPTITSPRPTASRRMYSRNIDDGYTTTAPCLPSKSGLTNGGRRPLSGRDRRSLMRERTGNAVRDHGFQFRSCPRNCKRRARATEPLGITREGGDGR